MQKLLLTKTGQMLILTVMTLGLLACGDNVGTQVIGTPANNTVTTSTPDAAIDKRNAADACPRLIQKRVDTTQSIRRESISVSSCDYFIYPKIGDTVSVSVSNGSLKPTLRMPVFHDFANGNYVVTNNGRHVIRVEYDAIATRPNILEFEIEVDIKPAS